MPATQICPQPLLRWHPATWDDYVTVRDDPKTERVKLFFNGCYLLTDMGGEGIGHSSVVGLFRMVFGFWFAHFPEPTASDLSGCLLEKANQQAASPDLVLYVGADAPQWQAGQRRYVDLNCWRLPDLVGEISDTTLESDLDEKKHLYATLGIPEYWVIDVVSQRVMAFQLQPGGRYERCEDSSALQGLPISLLQETLARLTDGSNIEAASWFAQSIAKLGLQ